MEHLIERYLTYRMCHLDIAPHRNSSLLQLAVTADALSDRSSSLHVRKLPQ